MNIITEQNIDLLLEATYEILDSEPDRAMEMIAEAHADSVSLGYWAGVARAQLRLAQAAVFKGDYVMALKVAKEALSLYENVVDVPEEKLILLRYMADSYFYLNDFRAALEYGKRSLAMCEQLDDGVAMAKVLHSVGNIYCRIHHYAEAFVHYKKSLALKQQYGFSPTSIAQGLENIGIVFLELGEYQKAMEYLSKAGERFRSLGTNYQHCVNQLNIGVALGLSKRYDESLDLLHSLRKKCEAHKFPSLHASILSNLSEVLLKKGDLQAAIDYATEGCSICHQFELRNNTYARCMISIFRCQFALGNATGALNIGRECLTLCRRIGFHSLTMTLLKELIKAEEKVGSERRALAAAKELLILQEEMVGRKRDFNIYHEQTRLELELKQREIDMQEKLNEHLLKLNKGLENFVTTASHDLREPLRTINFFSHKISTSTLQRRDLEYLSLIQEAGSRMTELIDSLLLYARSGNIITTPPEPISLSDVMMLVENNMRSSIKGARAKIEYSELPTVIAHKVFMVQLFQNIISNSIKYSRRGLPPVIRISAKRSDQGHYMVITDNGLGIKTSELENIFEPFTQIRTVGTGHGIGLGLATCRRIVEQYGGSIWATSRLGQGSEFHILIPFRE